MPGATNSTASSTPASVSIPIFDYPISGMVERPAVSEPVEHGTANSADWWVEYPNKLVDVSRQDRLPTKDVKDAKPPALRPTQAEIACDGGFTVRVDKERTAIVIIDMQNFFLHPDLRNHPTGLKCVQPLMNVVPALRKMGSKVLWVNWGLTDHELQTIPPSLIRGFRKQNGGGGFGSTLPSNFGRLLMREAYNSDLYGPLQDEYLKGKEAGTDFWIHKNRMSGLWGYQTALDLFLREHGITTLLFAGVNSDQCVLGTLVDAYFRGYDCILLADAHATGSPEGGYENIMYNAGGSYGFVTDTERVIAAANDN